MNVINFDRNICKRVEEYLDYYLNNELLVETTQEVLNHLEECAECSRTLEARTQTRDLLRRAVARDTAPPELMERIQKSIREDRPHAGLSPVLKWLGLAAALILATVVSFQIWRNTSLPEDPEIAQTAQAGLEQKRYILKIGLDDHIYCTGHLPSSPPDLEKLVKMLGTENAELLPVVSERVPNNYKIVEAHQCQYNGREFVHLIMKDQESLLSLTITR
jgi:mycothiol system anti-sigma-R factor